MYAGFSLVPLVFRISSRVGMVTFLGTCEHGGSSGPELELARTPEVEWHEVVPDRRMPRVPLQSYWRSLHIHGTVKAGVQLHVFRGSYRTDLHDVDD